MTLGVQINPAIAGLLSNSSMLVTACDLVDRFETLGGELFSPTENGWRDGGTLRWCDRALDAIVLAAYQEHHGYRTELLRDLAAYAPDGGGHVVLTSRPEDGS